MRARPYVRPPRMVKERGTVKNLRHGRGFSECEVEKAGLTVEKAVSLGIPIDSRRRSCHEWNVRILTEILGSRPGAPGLAAAGSPS